MIPTVELSQTHRGRLHILQMALACSVSQGEGSMARTATWNLDSLHFCIIAFQDLPGDTRRSTVGPRWNLRWGPKRIRGGTWPGGHRGSTTQCGSTSRRRSRSRASRQRSGWWNSRSSPLWCRAGRRRPNKQREVQLQPQAHMITFQTLCHLQILYCLQYHFSTHFAFSILSSRHLQPLSHLPNPSNSLPIRRASGSPTSPARPQHSLYTFSRSQHPPCKLLVFQNLSSPWKPSYSRRRLHLALKEASGRSVGLSPWASGTCVQMVCSAPAARSRPPAEASGCWWWWC